MIKKIRKFLRSGIELNKVQLEVVLKQKEVHEAHLSRQKTIDVARLEYLETYDPLLIPESEQELSILKKLVEPSEDGFALIRLYKWLRDEEREAATTKFTAGPLRNVAREMEFLLANAKKNG